MRHKPRINPLHLGLGTVVLMLVVINAIMINGIPGGPHITLPWNSTVTVRAQLSDADALAPKAGVQIAGVKIGEVRNVDLTGSAATVTMDIYPQYADIHSDAKVQLRPHGLFGPKYIELDPGSSSAPLLRDGDTIPGNQAVLPVDLDQILQELQAPERQQLSTAIVELGKAAAGRGTDFNHLVQAGNTLFSVLDSPVKSLDNVSSNLSDMLVQDEAFNASFAQAPLDQLVAASNVSLRAFAQTSAQLGDLLDHADATLTNLDAALSGQSGNLRATLEQLPGDIDKLDQFNTLLGRFSAALTGNAPDVTGESVLSGIEAAIENPLSASQTADVCDQTKEECSPFDGKAHAIRVQTFGGFSAPQSGYSPGAYFFLQSPSAGSRSAAPSDLLTFGALIGS